MWLEKKKDVYYVQRGRPLIENQLTMLLSFFFYTQDIARILNVSCSIVRRIVQFNLEEMTNFKQLMQKLMPSLQNLYTTISLVVRKCMRAICGRREFIFSATEFEAVFFE